MVVRGFLKDLVLATLAYYDVFDYPLTEAEISRALIRRGVEDISNDVGPILAKLKKEGIIAERDGYYFLFGREFLISLRQRHARVADHLWRRARRVGRLLMWIPFIRGIFVSGSLAFNNTDELSDIDVLVVARSGRIWLARLCAHALLAFFWLRRKHSDNIAPGKICLNHFIADNSLEIPLRSMYNAQTYAHLVPLFVDKPTLLIDFFWRNSWLKKYLLKPQIEPRLPMAIALPLIWVRRILNIVFGGRIGDWLEYQACKYQRAKIHSRGALPQGVIVSDTMLCFHPDSIESEVLQAYEDNLTKLKIFVNIKSVELRNL